MSDRVPGTPQTLTASELQQLQLDREAEKELALLAREDADLLLLSDYTARALTLEQMTAVEARLADDAPFRELAMTLLEARDVMRAHVDREMDAATPGADAAWRRLQDRETRDLWNETERAERRGRREGGAPAGERRPMATPAPRHRMRLLLRVGAIGLAVVVLGYVGGIVWPLVRGSEILRDRWEVHRERGGMSSFTVPVSSGVSISGIAPAFVAVRRHGVLDSGLRSDDVQEIYADGAMITVHVSATDGSEVQVEAPLFTLRAREGHAVISSQLMGSRVIQVLSGRVVVTVNGERNRAITIGEGFELSVTADGTIDRTPPTGVSGFQRVPVEELKP